MHTTPIGWNEQVHKYRIQTPDAGRQAVRRATWTVTELGGWTTFVSLANRSSWRALQRPTFAKARAGSLRASHERRLAEREGFEPPVPFRVQWFSRPPPSTTRPPLHLLIGGAPCTPPSGLHSLGRSVPAAFMIGGNPCLARRSLGEGGHPPSGLHSLPLRSGRALIAGPPARRAVALAKAATPPGSLRAACTPDRRLPAPA